MTKQMSDHKVTPRLVALAANQAVTIAARRGTEVRSLRGDVWITQEGDPQDYIVPEGARFCAGRRTRLVVSAPGAPGRILVSLRAPREAGALATSRVVLDYRHLDALRSEAERLRAREIARLLRRGARAVRRAWCRITSAAAPGCRGAAASRTRTSWNAS